MLSLAHQGMPFGAFVAIDCSEKRAAWKDWRLMWAMVAESLTDPVACVAAGSWFSSEKWARLVLGDLPVFDDCKLILLSSGVRQYKSEGAA